MKDFVRIMPKQGCENWPAKLGRMSQLYSEVEYETVKEGLRPAAIVNFDPENLQEKMEQINKDGLLFTPLDKISVFAGYSLLSKLLEPGEPFLWKGALTKNYKDAQLIKKAYFGRDHKAIGKLLGFPKCCAEYFTREFTVNPDPVWVNLNGKVEGFSECNTLLRYFGPRMTAHMPCSPKCVSSQKIGKAWFGIMQKINEVLAREFYDLLSAPTIWNSYHGVVQVETPYFIGLSKTFPYLRKPRIINWNSRLPKISRDSLF